ncbi:Gfo/Idh/MocA family protein [Leptospira sp. GIMC2001]|uniref:Gfo/Idh/MocA family protein n=1 Tax=Leptospira sp. GIMC2001 TaxID=1513297 RepID=UPI00234BEC34|nr:Gfo/Idh/MocA family oxidoreductase [Leptospira sp. GIMC2001]WCL47989.1 Gfo/Idh/MocA family oxidoreductase [Leptospira sp. GIMC2001]
MKKIRVILVGLGRIASILEKDPYRNKPCTHAGTIFSNSSQKKFILQAIVDSNPERITQFRKDWNHLIESNKNPISVYNHLDEVTKHSDTSFDLCVIATNSDSHFSNAKKAIELKIPNLLIEKPVALNLSDSKKLFKLASKNQTKIWVNHERRYHPVYSWVREQIHSGKWGKIKTIHASILTSRLSPGIAYKGVGGGPLMHDGTHIIDYLHWLVGNPINIQAKATKSNRKYKLDEQIVATLEYRDGVFAFLEVGGYRNYFQFAIDIYTENARFILSNDGFQFFQSQPSKLYKGFKSLVEKKIPANIMNNPNPFPRIYASIAYAIQNNQEPETGGIQDNLEIMNILNKISLATKRKT